jgi:hypothetical protein
MNNETDARAEQHFFVDADKEGRIKRMYWVQFEGYLPINTHTYNYRSTQKVNLGGLEFIADLGKDGKAAAQWPEIAKGLLERAGKMMTVMALN